MFPAQHIRRAPSFRCFVFISLYMAADNFLPLLPINLADWKRRLRISGIRGNRLFKLCNVVPSARLIADAVIGAQPYKTH